MSITAICGACGRNFIAPAQFEGKRVKCKGCGEIFVVTVAPSLNEIGHEEDADAPLAQLAAATATRSSPVATSNPFDRSDEDQDFEATGAGFTPNVLTFNYAGAADIDRWLPITLIVIGFLMLSAGAGNQDSKATGWIAFTRFITPSLLYLAFTFPITLLMLKKAADEQRFALPPSPGLRCFASYMPAFVLITWMQMAGDGLTFMQLFAGVFGVALSSAILWLLFRLREEHIGTTVVYGAAGFAAGIFITILLTLGLNKVGQELVVSQRAQASVPVSPFGEGLAWVPPLPTSLMAPAVEKPVTPQPTIAPKTTAATFSPGTTTIGEFLTTAIPGSIDDVISPCSTSPFAGVIRARPAGISIEAWNVLSGEQKPGTLQLPGRPTGNIVMSIDGERLAWIAEFPRLAVQIWSFTAGSVVSSVDLDRSQGNAELIAFVSSDLLLIDHTTVKSTDLVASATVENSPTAAVPAAPSPPASDDFFQELNTRSRRNHDPGSPLPPGEPTPPAPVIPPAAPLAVAPTKSESAPQILPISHAGEHRLEIVDVTNGSTVRNFTLPTVGEDPNSSPGNPSHSLHYGQNITLSTAKQRMAAAVKVNGIPSIVQFDLVTGKNLSTVKVAEIDPSLSTSPTGLAYSNDGTTLAALFENAGSALLLAYDTTTARRTANFVYPSGPLEGSSHNMFRQSAICPLDPSPFWLVYGQGLISNQTGAHLKSADLNIPGVSAQRFLDDDQVQLVSNTGSGKKIIVLKLDRTKLETALDIGAN